MTADTNCVSRFDHVTLLSDQTVPWLLHCPDPVHFEPNDLDELSAAPIDVFIVHGRSSRTSLFPLDSLLDSNEQLVDLDPRRRNSPDLGNSIEYRVPDGGVKEGLCGKIILLLRQQ